MKEFTLYKWVIEYDMNDGSMNIVTPEKSYWVELEETARALFKLEYPTAIITSCYKFPE